MKKIIIAALALLGLASASAQYITTTEVGNAKGWTAFTSDPVSRMAGYNGATVNIYNDDFSIYKSFSLELSESERINQMDQVVVSQHQFNSDDLYEVVVISDGEWNVHNEQSEMLGIIPSPNLMRVGEKNYIYTYDNGEYILYEHESHTNSLVSVRKLEGVRVFPNPANAGESHLQPILTVISSRIIKKGRTQITQIRGFLADNIGRSAPEEARRLHGLHRIHGCHRILGFHG